MKKRRVTKQELFILRNHVDINKVIETHLMIPSTCSEGYLRFQCPLCSAFHTATNPKTNLARCFRCNKNFNSIDMVMLVNRTNFLETVAFLQGLLRTERNCGQREAMP